MSSARLEIYVEPGCRICDRSEYIAAEIRAKHADVEVLLIDMSGPGGDHRNLVIAAPTYILNGRVISLGNPDRLELAREIALVQEGTPR